MLFLFLAYLLNCLLLGVCTDKQNITSFRIHNKRQATLLLGPPNTRPVSRPNLKMNKKGKKAHRIMILRTILPRATIRRTAWQLQRTFSSTAQNTGLQLHAIPILCS